MDASIVSIAVSFSSQVFHLDKTALKPIELRIAEVFSYDLD